MNANPPSSVLFPATHSAVRGLIARLAIQCTHPESGLTGDWLYSGETHRAPGSAVSPLFSDLGALFSWARLNGWEGTGSLADTVYTLTGREHGARVETAMAERHANVI